MKEDEKERNKINANRCNLVKGPFDKSKSYKSPAFSVVKHYTYFISKQVSIVAPVFIVCFHLASFSSSCVN